MSPGKIGKLTLDLAMTALLVVVMACRITGETVHGRLGMVLLTLFIVHNIVNRRWYTTLFKGRYNYVRFCNNAVNVALLAAMLVTMLSGIFIAKNILPAAYDYGRSFRQIHAAAHHWSLLLAGAHLGLYWGVILAPLLKLIGPLARGMILKAVLRCLAVLIILGGIKAAVAKDMGAKLVMYYSFSFWDADTPAGLYILDYVLLMAACACLVYYLLRLIKKVRRPKPQTKSQTA